MGVKVAELGVEFTKSAAEAGIFAQESRMAMTSLLHGNADEAAEEFDNTRKMAVDLGLGVDSTIDKFKELLRAQFSVGQSQGLIKMAGDMQSVGAKAQEVEQILSAMSQIKSMGKLTQYDARRLEEAGISGKLIMEQLQKSLHLSSVEAVRKHMEAGKVTADVGIEAIEGAVMAKTGESALGQAGERFASGTVSGQMAKMKGMFSNMMIDAGDAMMPGLVRIEALVTGSFNRLMANPEVQGIGAKLLTGFNEFVGWLEENWPRIEQMIPPALELIGTVVDGVIGSIQFLLENIDYIVGTAKVLGYTFLAFAAVGAIVVAGIVGIGIAVYGVGYAIWWLGDQIVQFCEWVADVVPEWLQNLFGGGAGVTANLSAITGPAANNVNGEGSSGLRSNAASVGANGPPNISNISGDKILNLALSVAAPPGGTEADGEAFGKGTARGINSQIMGFLGSNSENAA